MWLFDSSGSLCNSEAPKVQYFIESEGGGVYAPACRDASGVVTNYGPGSLDLPGAQALLNRIAEALGAIDTRVF